MVAVSGSKALRKLRWLSARKKNNNCGATTEKNYEIGASEVPQRDVASSATGENTTRTEKSAVLRKATSPIEASASLRTLRLVMRRRRHLFETFPWHLIRTLFRLPAFTSRIGRAYDWHFTT